MAIRNYNMPDAQMFQASRTKRTHFIFYKSDFVNFDGDFDDPYAQDWLDSLEDSEGTESAETRADTGQQETADVLAVMLLGHKKHIEMKYFITKAFGNKPAIMAKFGLDKYEEARSDQAKLAVYLENMYKQANSADYKPALLTANCTQAKIDAILTIKTGLSTEDTEQNAFLETSSVATRDRIVQFNNTDEFWKKVNAASKSIFYDDHEVLNLFLYPRNSEPSSSFNVLGAATFGVAATPVDGAVVQIEALGLSTTTDNNGEWGFGAVPNGSGNLKFTKAGFTDLIVSYTKVAGVALVVNVVMLAV